MCTSSRLGNNYVHTYRLGSVKKSVAFHALRRIEVDSDIVGLVYVQVDSEDPGRHQKNQPTRGQFQWVRYPQYNKCVGTVPNVHQGSKIF